MGEFRNGMAADTLTDTRWIKASASDAINCCVEIATVGENTIAMRNSRFAGGPALIFTREEFTAFLDGASKGEFNHMTV